MTPCSNTRTDTMSPVTTPGFSRRIILDTISVLNDQPTPAMLKAFNRKSSTEMQGNVLDTILDIVVPTVWKA